MKKTILIIVLILNLTLVLNAQTEKIKGDRNVTIKQTYIDDFQSIIVDTDFSIELVYNSKPSVEIEADENLHDVLKFEVIDGVLSFSKTMRITSKKKLNIKVNHGDALNTIITKDDGEIRSLTSMELGDVNLTTADNARAYLNIRAKNFTYKSSGKSKTRLNITADSSSITLIDNSKLDAQVSGKIANFNLSQSADAVVNGVINSSEINLDESTDFEGGKFKVSNANVTLQGSSDLTLDVSDSITISASGNSEIYLYGSPKIAVDKFEDTAKLQKKKSK